VEALNEVEAENEVDAERDRATPLQETRSAEKEKKVYSMQKL